MNKEKCDFFNLFFFWNVTLSKFEFISTPSMLFMCQIKLIFFLYFNIEVPWMHSGFWKIKSWRIWYTLLTSFLVRDLKSTNLTREIRRVFIYLCWKTYQAYASSLLFTVFILFRLLIRLFYHFGQPKLTFAHF